MTNAIIGGGEGRWSRAGRPAGNPLDVLERTGLIERHVAEGDDRRRGIAADSQLDGKAVLRVSAAGALSRQTAYVYGVGETAWIVRGQD